MSRHRGFRRSVPPLFCRRDARKFAGFLGAAFAPVKSDISGNVVKVRTKYESNPGAMRYVEDLVDVDLREHNGNLGIATEGLLWLKRCVILDSRFVCIPVQRTGIHAGIAHADGEGI